MNSNSKKISEGMLDISHKEITKRIARAQSIIEMTPKAFTALMDGGSPKGDVFETARVAGIMAAKSTPAVIPLCHPLSLSKVNIQFETDQKKQSIIITSEVVCVGKTGVEMEALTATSIAALTIYDMMKWADKGSIIKETKLLSKSGGKSGDFNVE